MKTSYTTFVGIGLTMALGLGACACQKQHEDSAEHSVPSAEPESAAVDPNLAKAVAAASATRPGGADQTQGEGPPPGGVFAPGRADQIIERGALPVITVGALGGTPKVSLGARQPKPGSRQKATVQVSMQIGPRPTPLFNFALAVEAAKAKPKGDAEAVAGGPPGSPSAVEVLARILGAEIDPTQASRVPEHELQLVAKLKGGGVHFRTGVDGGSGAFQVEMAKAADPGLKHTVDALSEILANVALPAPADPVGPGAYWMATSRDSVAEVDTVTYRMIKVEKVQDGSVTVEMNVKRYAASSAINPEGVPPELGTVELARFQATGKGSLVLKPDVLLPVEGRYSSEVAAFASSPKAPGQLLPVGQMRITAQLGEPAPQAPTQ